MMMILDSNAKIEINAYNPPCTGEFVQKVRFALDMPRRATVKLNRALPLLQGVGKRYSTKGLCPLQGPIVQFSSTLGLHLRINIFANSSRHDCLLSHVPVRYARPTDEPELTAESDKLLCQRYRRVMRDLWIVTTAILSSPVLSARENAALLRRVFL